MRQIGDAIMRPNLDNVILGSPLNYLYEKSQLSLGYGDLIFSICYEFSSELFSYFPNSLLIVLIYKINLGFVKFLPEMRLFKSLTKLNFKHEHSNSKNKIKQIFSKISEDIQQKKTNLRNYNLNLIFLLFGFQTNYINPSINLKIILLQEEMRSSKKLPNFSQTKGGRSQPVIFRTIFKNKYDSLTPLQPKELERQLKRRSDSRVSLQSVASRSKREKETIQIKEYVKQMRNRKDGQQSQRLFGEEISTNLKASRMSTRSKNDLNNSRLQQSLQKISSCTVEQLEKRIQNLLSLKLQRLKIMKIGVGMSSLQLLKKSNLLEPELQEIILKFRSLDGQQSLSELSNRLQLIERLIASEVIESQLLRQRYSNLKNQRCNISSFQNKHLIATSTCLNRSIHRPQGISSDSKLKNIAQFISTNRQAYSKPSKDYYATPKFKHQPYVPNRQVLPRSCYSTEFLNYGTMPTFSSNQNSIQFLGQSSLAVKASSYQQQYKDKYNLLKPINYKQLDCYHNKFKNPNVSFMENCKKKMIDVTSTLKRAKRNKQTVQLPKNNSQMLSKSTFNDFYKTEQKKSYISHRNSQSQLIQWGKGQPKNERLECLKQSFRAALRS